MHIYAIYFQTFRDICFGLTMKQFKCGCVVPFVCVVDCLRFLSLERDREREW